MKKKIEQYEKRQKDSINAFQRNLDQKVQTAKETNIRMEEAARKAKEVFQKKMA